MYKTDWKMTQKYHTFSMAKLGAIKKISMLLMQLFFKKRGKIYYCLGAPILFPPTV